MHSSRMCTAHSLTVYHIRSICQGRVCMVHMPPCHAHPSCMPPTIHAPYHACPPPTTPLPCMPPCHTRPLPHMPPHHACPLPAMHAPSLPCMPPSCQACPPVNRMTDGCKNITLPKLCLLAVTRSGTSQRNRLRIGGGALGAHGTPSSQSSTLNFQVVCTVGAPIFRFGTLFWKILCYFLWFLFRILDRGIKRLQVQSARMMS